MSDERREPVVTATTELVSRASENPPGEEQAVATWLVDRLDDSPVPFTVESEPVAPDQPNVVARTGDPERGSVLLTGHTDVVPANADDWTTDPYEPTVRDGRLYGRGTADMKGAIGAMIVATERYCKRTDAPGEVVLGFVVDEEHGGAGMQAFVDNGLEADVAVVGEPTDLDVCTAIKGVARYEAVVEGESCHSGQPDEGRDAIRGLRELIARVEALDDELESTSHSVLAHEDVTVTEVTGGLAPNVVAGSATATIDWRCLPGETEPGPLDDRIHGALADLRVDGAALSVALDRTVFARAGETDPNHRIVTATLDAAHERGIDAEVIGFDAATDARFLIHDAEIPTVHFGPGSLTEDAHTVDESVAVADLVAATAVYEEVLSRTLR